MNKRERHKAASTKREMRGERCTSKLNNHISQCLDQIVFAYPQLENTTLYLQIHPTPSEPRGNNPPPTQQFRDTTFRQRGSSVYPQSHEYTRQQQIGSSRSVLGYAHRPLWAVATPLRPHTSSTPNSPYSPAFEEG
jgi:hypothetical protein